MDAPKTPEEGVDYIITRLEKMRMDAIGRGEMDNWKLLGILVTTFSERQAIEKAIELRPIFKNALVKCITTLLHPSTYPKNYEISTEGVTEILDLIKLAKLGPEETKQMLEPFVLLCCERLASASVIRLLEKYMF
jgi:hypothetical protein